MILLGKFSETIGVGDSLKDNFDKSKQCVAIADDYAIEFYCWMIKLEEGTIINKEYAKGLLTAFKKEKGL
jgi:hypothetical protein